MPQKNPSSKNDLELAAIISRLENRVISRPSEHQQVVYLLKLLDCQSPYTTGNGVYSSCQQALNAHFNEANVNYENLTPSRLIVLVDEWREILNRFPINQNVPITQIFEGKKNTIEEKYTKCNNYMNFFMKTAAIKSTCFSCYKVQIIPADIISFMMIYIAMKNIDLPRDNLRKCMVELRESVPNPYKGYIFCQSEEEAIFCLHEMNSIIEKFEIKNVKCGISHGCSEYGLKYPEFKYAENGSHKNFSQPKEWGDLESNTVSTPKNSMIQFFELNKYEITLRDVICFDTWIKYAEIIGDRSFQSFSNFPTEMKYNIFTERVRKQAGARQAQITKLMKFQSAEN